MYNECADCMEHVKTPKSDTGSEITRCVVCNKHNALFTSVLLFAIRITGHHADNAQIETIEGM